jgi:hypothetical protein
MCFVNLSVVLFANFLTAKAKNEQQGDCPLTAHGFLRHSSSVITIARSRLGMA